MRFILIFSFLLVPFAATAETADQRIQRWFAECRTEKVPYDEAVKAASKELDRVGISGTGSLLATHHLAVALEKRRTWGGVDACFGRKVNYSSK